MLNEMMCSRRYVLYYLLMDIRFYYEKAWPVLTALYIYCGNLGFLGSSVILRAENLNLIFGLGSKLS